MHYAENRYCVCNKHINMYSERSTYAEYIYGKSQKLPVKIFTECVERKGKERKGKNENEDTYKIP